MLSRRDIREAAHALRAKYWPSGTIPIDVEWIAESAGCLLVPEPELRRLCDEHEPKMRAALQQAGLTLETTDPDSCRAILASSIHRAFEVSPTVIEIRLRKSGIVSNQ